MRSNQNNAVSTPEQRDERSQIVLNALSMAFGTMSSRVLGLVREMAFAALFSREVTDAWIAAFRLPNMFRRLLGEGSLSVSFIPVFVEANIENPGGGDKTSTRARNLVNGFYTLLLVILSVITIVGIFYAESILKIVLDQNYTSQVEKFAMTVRMAKIMFGFVFLVSTYAYFMGILNALGRYGLAAMAPTFFNIAMIISTILPTNWFTYPGDGLAWGVIVGGFLQAAILIPALIRLGYFPSMSWAWGNPDILKVFKNMIPGLIGLGLLQITTIINMKFASELGEGPISYINWADRLLELPLSLISVSLGAALLPTLAGMWTKGEKQKMAETTNFYLRLNMFVGVAAALGLYFLAQPIVEVLYMRGKFSLSDATATAGVVQVWALIMIPTSCVRVLAPAYYAIKNTWFPALVSALCLGVHLVVAPRLMHQYGLSGLNYSSLVSSCLNFILLLVCYQFLVTKLNYQMIVMQFIKYLIAGLALILAVQIYEPIYNILGAGFFAKLTALSLAILAGAGAYAFMSHIMKLEEYESTVKRVLSRLRVKIGKN